MVDTRYTNRRVNDDIVLDIGEDDRIAVIEILDSRYAALNRLLPVKYGVKQFGSKNMFKTFFLEKVT